MKLLYSCIIYILKNNIPYKEVNIPTDLIEFLDEIVNFTNKEKIKFAVNKRSIELLNHVCKSSFYWNLALIFASENEDLEIANYCESKVLYFLSKINR